MTPPAARTVVFLLLLTGVAALSTLLLLSVSDQPTDDRPPGLSLSFYVLDAEVLGTDESGAVVYRMQTNRAEQNTKDQSILLQQIDMQYGPPEGPTWSLSSDAGRMTSDAAQIELRGNVRAELAGTQSATTVIQTTQLDFEPSIMVARTTSRVAISFDARVLYASGLEANMETNSLQLLSNVYGKFTP